MSSCAETPPISQPTGFADGHQGTPAVTNHFIMSVLLSDFLPRHAGTETVLQISSLRLFSAVTNYRLTRKGLFCVSRSLRVELMFIRNIQPTCADYPLSYMSLCLTPLASITFLVGFKLIVQDFFPFLL